MRERFVKKSICSCGGDVYEVETVSEEEVKYGCGRKGCCIRAFQCKKCNVRFLLKIDAPEID